MIVQKNRHLEAATAILGNKRQAKALLHTLEPRAGDSYQFVVMNRGQIDLALLLVHNAGETTTCLVTPPKMDGEIERTSKLIRTAIEPLRVGSIKLAQTLMEVDQPLLANAYEDAGFTKLAILTYMERSKSVKLDDVPSGKVTFVSMHERTDELLQTTLLESYIGSLDCPKIHGLRHIKDIVEGHRNQGAYDAQLWTIAELGGVPVGVLLLSPIPEATCMELSYLGVIPSARGKGVGDALMHLAIEQTSENGLSRIVLAVDSANSPAGALYQRWKFRATRQRLSMIQKLY
jgi:ribosomal protein S18 acetylase RimI-like enzyme